MMQRKKAWPITKSYIFWILLLLTSEVPAQAIGYTIAGARHRMEIPFENLNNLIVIPVKINGVLPTKFILDSGVALTILTEKAILDILHLPCDRRINMPVIGKKDSVVGCISTMVRLDLPGVISLGQNMVVLHEDFLNLKSYLGENVQGIIGYDLFKNFIIEVDYINKVITLIQPGYFRPPRSYEKVPLQLIGNRPYIESLVTTEDGQTRSVNLLLDLGASHAVMFEMDSAQPIGIPSKCIESVVGRGLGGDITGFLGRIDHLQIGSFRFNDVVISFSDTYIDNDNSRSYRQGTLGGEVLSRFHLVVDYTEGAIYLKRNFTFSRPFEYNLSGMEIMASGINLNEFVVSRINPKSPAEQAGILPGDKIILFNGRFTGEMSLNEINHLLRTKPGKRIWLKVERDGKWLKRSFRLQRSI